MHFIQQIAHDGPQCRLPPMSGLEGLFRPVKPLAQHIPFRFSTVKGSVRLVFPIFFFVLWLLVLFEPFFRREFVRKTKFRRVGIIRFFISDPLPPWLKPATGQPFQPLDIIADLPAAVFDNFGIPYRIGPVGSVKKLFGLPQFHQSALKLSRPLQFESILHTEMPLKVKFARPAGGVVRFFRDCGIGLRITFVFGI